MRHRETGTELDRSGPPNGGISDEVLVDVAVRLRRLVEEQGEIVESLNDARNREDEITGLARLRRCTDRLRRAAEDLLILGGAEPSRSAPLALSALLAGVVSSAAAGGRVALGGVPSATVVGDAATDVVGLVSELVERTLAAATPHSGVHVAARWSDEGGIVVEVSGDARLDDASGPAGGPALELAARLGRRCRIGVSVRPGPSGGTSCLVHCPGHLLLAADAPQFGSPPPAASTVVPAHPVTPPPVAPPPAPPLPTPDGREPADDLFGPLPSRTGDDVADTPIFEAIASAWFREAEPQDVNGSSPAGPQDWDAADDLEWAAATARAARPEPAEVTSAGLPRRDPGNQMITPPLRRTEPALPGGRTEPAPPGAGAERVPSERAPERVRHRLAVYQQGLRRGRHRAEDPADEPAVDDDGWWQLEG